MKCNYIVLAVCVASVQLLHSTDLRKAIADNLVKVDLTGTDFCKMPATLYKDNFAPKMQLTVHNLGREPIEMELDPGYMLEPVEKYFQSMLLTQAIVIRLQPDSSTSQYIHAMCTEMARSAPSCTHPYQIGETAKPLLLKLAKFIAENNYQSGASQQAVWCVTAGLPILAINGFDAEMNNQLQQVVADIYNVNLEKIKQKAQNQPRTELLQEFNGNNPDRNIVFTVERDSALVSVAFYDGRGQLVKTLFCRRTYRNGTHCIRYNPYLPELAGKMYSVRMFKNGVIEREYFFMQ